MRRVVRTEPEVADWLLEHGWTPPEDIATYEATDPLEAF